MAILEIEKTQDGQENHLDIVPTLDRLFLYLLGDLSACLDHDRFGSSSGLGSDFFNLIDDIESICSHGNDKKESTLELGLTSIIWKACISSMKTYQQHFRKLCGSFIFGKGEKERRILSGKRQKFRVAVHAVFTPCVSRNYAIPTSVLSIQPWGIDGADEELRSVCVRAGVGHRT